MTRRSISTTRRARIFADAGGICTFCGHKIDGVKEAWEISHDIPLELGGADDGDNLQPAHKSCHRAHTAKVDIPTIAKAKRVAAKHSGAWKSRNPLRGGKDDKLKRKIDGTVVPREK